MDILKKIQQRRVNRRNFLAGAGALGATSALAGCTSAAAPTAVIPSSDVFVDNDYLNFALNLEYLEASFYLYAATGAGIPSAVLNATGVVGTPGTVTGGAMVAGLSSAQQQIINEIAFDELTHVKALQTVIGAGNFVAMPNINIGTAFQALAAAALAFTPSSGIPASFTPYTNFTTFLLGAFIFEDVGVTAYAGAAPYLASSTNINYAAGILAVEAYHAAYVRTTLTAGSTGMTVASGYPYIAYANAISALRSALGGGAETQLTLIPAADPVNTSTTSVYTASTVVAASSSNAVGYSRNTDQVLHIVYGSAGSGAGVANGAFFPNGMNGNIKVTLS